MIEKSKWKFQQQFELATKDDEFVRLGEAMCPACHKFSAQVLEGSEREVNLKYCPYCGKEINE